MTGIHPVQGFKNLSTPKKVAVVAGTAAGVAAVATTAVAYSKGKKADAKGLEALKKGYGMIFEAAKTKAGKALESVKSLFNKKENVAAVASEVPADEGNAALNSIIPN